jgi:hypothetical protein
MNANKISIALAFFALALGLAESAVQQRVERLALSNRSAAAKIEAAKMQAEASSARESALSSPVRLARMAARHLDGYRPMRPRGDLVRTIEIPPAPRPE